MHWSKHSEPVHHLTHHASQPRAFPKSLWKPDTNSNRHSHHRPGMHVVTHDVIPPSCNTSSTEPIPCVPKHRQLRIIKRGLHGCRL